MHLKHMPCALSIWKCGGAITTRKTTFCDTYSATPISELLQNRHLWRFLRLVDPTVAYFLAFFFKSAFTYTFCPDYFTPAFSYFPQLQNPKTNFIPHSHFPQTQSLALLQEALLSPSLTQSETQSYSLFISNPLPPQSAYSIPSSTSIEALLSTKIFSPYPIIRSNPNSSPTFNLFQVHHHFVILSLFLFQFSSFFIYF